MAARLEVACENSRPSSLPGPSNEVHFVSLADNFTVPFSKLLKLPSVMENKNA